MAQQLDLFDYIINHTIKLRADKRLDLRIIINISLRISLHYAWYLAYKEESKFTKIAIGMNLVTWPFYHIFVVLTELRYMEKGNFELAYRKTAFKIFDQIQYFILMIEFLLLVFLHNYYTLFHTLVATFLSIDFILYIFQIGYNYKNKKIIKQELYQQIPQKLNRSGVSLRISTELVQAINQPTFKQILEFIQSIQKDKEHFIKYHQKIFDDQLKMIQTSQNTKGEEIVFQFYLRPDDKFDISTSILSDECEVKAKKENKQNDETIPIFSSGDEDSTSLFYLTFTVGSILSSVILIQVITRYATEDQTLLYLGILEIIGNGIIVLGVVIKFFLSWGFSLKSFFHSSFSKSLSSLIQGFVCGLTSTYYGVIFGAIFVALIALFLLCTCAGSGKTKIKIVYVKYDSLLGLLSGLF